MPRFIAFLRAVNVGGRTVKMDHLRRLFESLGLVNVETFIASGNVIFELPRGRAKSSASRGAEMAETALELKIETALREALGYDVTTFLRTSAALAEVARHQPFDTSALAEMIALNVAFLGSVPDAAAVRGLLALQTGGSRASPRSRVRCSRGRLASAPRCAESTPSGSWPKNTARCESGETWSESTGEWTCRNGL